MYSLQKQFENPNDLANILVSISRLLNENKIKTIDNIFAEFGFDIEFLIREYDMYICSALFSIQMERPEEGENENEEYPAIWKLVENYGIIIRQYHKIKTEMKSE